MAQMQKRLLWSPLLSSAPLPFLSPSPPPVRQHELARVLPRVALALLFVVEWLPLPPLMMVVVAPIPVVAVLLALVPLVVVPLLVAVVVAPVSSVVVVLVHFWWR